MNREQRLAAIANPTHALLALIERVEALEAPLHTYAVGDPDTTPDGGEWCDAQDDETGAACTRRPDGHRQHAGGDGSIVVAVWVAS